MAIRRKLKGIIQIFRPELPLAAGMCVVLGEMLALSAFPPVLALTLGFACGFFLSASALIFNDYFDIEVDRINAPERPLPSGNLSKADVIILAIATALVGLAATWAFNPGALLPGFLIWVVGFLYNWKLKSMGLWGNLMVSTSVGMTFIIGGIGVGRAWDQTVWVFGLIAFAIDLGEEIAGDAMDAEGDRERQSRSIAIIRGKETALRIAAALFLLAVLLTFVPVLWGELGILYLIAISLADILILFFTTKLIRSQSPTEGRQAMRGIYLSASLGLLAFLIGSFLT
jgi:geranylgeranylglycerol-phosphate geranylgeranyltransferase